MGPPQGPRRPYNYSILKVALSIDLESWNSKYRYKKWIYREKVKKKLLLTTWGHPRAPAAPKNTEFWK